MENNNMFTVLPMSQRISLQPGQTYDGKITIVNPADATEDFAYKVSVAPYSVTENEHDDYTINLANETSYTAMTKWIKIEEPTGKIKPNESKDVHFTVTVPKDAPGGGQYAAISITSDQSESQNEGVSVQNVFEMASIIYGSVNGKTVRKGEIIENNVPGFVLNPPARLTATISNEGNIHEDASFIITVSDFFTGRVILPTEDNDGNYSEIVMPETTRYIEREVDNLPALGVVKVSQTIYYNGTSSVVEKNIIICPIWFMILVALTIAAIVATVIHLVKKHHLKKASAA